MSTLQTRLDDIQARVEGAAKASGRDKDSVRLIAVSKRQPDELLHEAWRAGQRDFGENYVQELVRKQALLPEARFHLIGHLQTNKAKKAASAAWIHTVDSEKVAKALARGLPPETSLSVLIEVNIAEESQKSGVTVGEVEPLLVGLRSLSQLHLAGLMCIPPAVDGRRWFAKLRVLAERMRQNTGLALPELSMGMSSDFEDAILEGATMVRVGTAIFGVRTY